jgi:hypothetical protein
MLLSNSNEEPRNLVTYRNMQRLPVKGAAADSCPPLKDSSYTTAQGCDEPSSQVIEWSGRHRDVQ